MTLLEDIQNAAIDRKSDLGTLLRKCKLLAARLNNSQLDNWVIWESNGYPSDVEIPNYRVWPLEVKGHFAGPFGAFTKNIQIPLALLPKNVRKSYEQYKCRQSIASIEAILEKDEGTGTLTISTGDLALALGTNVYEGQNCIQAWAECGRGHLVEVSNSVRNRILDFTLAVWKEAPTAGENIAGATEKLGAGRITQIFNTTVYGGAANLVGSADSSLITFNIGIKDFTSLERVLRDNGVSGQDINELKLALGAEGEVQKKDGYGPKVSAWVSKMMEKAADGSWNIGLGAAGNLLAQAIAKYYGLN